MTDFDPYVEIKRLREENSQLKQKLRIYEPETKEEKEAKPDSFLKTLVDWVINDS